MCTRHLPADEQADLLGQLEILLESFERLLGFMPGDKYSLKLKRNAVPVHARPFPLHQKHLKLMKDEVNFDVDLGFLRQAYNLKWAALSFVIPKKDNTFHFVSDFRG